MVEEAETLGLHKSSSTPGCLGGALGMSCMSAITEGEVEGKDCGMIVTHRGCFSLPLLFSSERTHTGK